MTDSHRCVRPGCSHYREQHTPLGGCLAMIGNGYCACAAYIGAEPAVPVQRTEPVMPTPGGVTYVQEIDGIRLNRQQQVVYTLMADGEWRTLREIADVTGFPEASVSARLRDFRKAPLNREVERRRRGGATSGTWEYAITQTPA